MPATSKARTSIQRSAADRARQIRLKIASDIRTAREDAGLSTRRLAQVAGVSDSTVRALELARHDPTTETMSRLSAVLGMSLAVGLYPGTGSVVRDRFQASMIEALLNARHAIWRPALEVGVRHPVRGVIDLVLERQPLEPVLDDPIVATEAQSDLRRIEQQVRWFHAKSDALAGMRNAAVASALLLRSTARTRAIVAEFAALLAAAYPARHQDALAALVDGTPFPGDAIIWCKLEGSTAILLDRPPRGISVGR